MASLIVKDAKEILKMELNSFEYLNKVFKGLPAEKQDHILNIARALLVVQDNNIYHTADKATCHDEESLATFDDKNYEVTIK